MKGSDIRTQHLRWSIDGKVGTVTLDRPERKNPLTFESYGELRELFRLLTYVEDVKAVVLTGAGENFCSGADMQEAIGPLTRQAVSGLMEFTRLSSEVVKAMRLCPQPIIAAIDGICAGAGATLAMAADLRFGTPRSKVAFLFVHVGLAGCDMGACALLPRIIGEGRAAELLYTGRALGGEEAERWGFFNRLCEPAMVQGLAAEMAESLAQGPSFAHGLTKRMLHLERSLSLEQALEAEAQAQALALQSQDFRRAYEAYTQKRPPVFEGN
ncbi:MAG TPA: enoyl-CoA hydratase family protein [Stellaceae bacterium]|nr:enoyl-CoA hydratase family protein [Stellaceae bacterium]